MKVDSEPLENASPDNDPEPRDPVPAEDLREQARRLRAGVRRGRLDPDAPSFLAKVLYLVFFAGVMGSVVYLLMFPAGRQELVLQVSEWWIAAARDVTRSHIYRLPPPPPKPADQKVVFQAPVPIVSGSGAPVETASSREETSDSPREVRSLEKTGDSEKAFRLLLEKSAAARDLTEGKISGQAYKEWRLVKDDVPVFWIDLVAARGSEPEVHLVWSVDLETRDVTALSQAARDLERPRSD